METAHERHETEHHTIRRGVLDAARAVLAGDRETGDR